jgi:hypothetical protein
VGTKYDVVRSTTVRADPARVHSFVDDFREWQKWSPWEGLDAALTRSYTGPDRGVGAAYAWEGNRKAGAGSMEITDSSPERVAVTLVFLRPFRSEQQVEFTFVPAPDVADGCEVSWRMRGEQTGVMGLFGRLVSMDKIVGKDFEKGLASLREVSEG